MLPEHDLEDSLRPGLPQEPDQPPPDAGALDRLAGQIAREHERAAHRELIIDRLHAENQELRRGLLHEAMTPVRSGLYRLYDTVRREAARLDGDGGQGHLAPLLDAIAEEVAEVLARTGAERLEVGPGDRYDPALHRPVRTEPGPEGVITAVLQDGFRLAEQDRILRKAQVAVGRDRTEESD
ncbi:nucleotide exchange factor GrpE [Acrocarpospora catenulata]|uniref:nucleotide exchange factor GrpE n=1 Tax=Acrocarpospora catenulata TaxID=2836182 RepID=UPI001BD9C7E2|nr:nucleotide exchange factor GrpE [Acrocarpospora catenulata]